MLLVTEYDSCLEVENKLPPSLVRKIYLNEGASSGINKMSTMFGDPVHFVYLGYNLRPVENFVNSLEGDTSNIILISPISRWGLYSVKLKGIEGLKVSNQFDSRESKIELLSRLTGLGPRKASKALSLLNYNFGLIERNLDLLRWCNSTGADIETALASVERYTYADILFYMCGSKKHTREKFIRTLSKYRYAKKGILKYLKDNLDQFIDHRLEGKEPAKEYKYTVDRLNLLLYLEDAIKLRYALDKVKDLSELLKGEIAIC